VVAEWGWPPLLDGLHMENYKRKAEGFINKMSIAQLFNTGNLLILIP
jgi:hypothetical protein